ncbi:(deoxy)nucleoside triphosphate pyrophosphohydrolase [Halobacillus sp. B29]|uniref:(deoxy)nucleoside triphosphate pyrophosphohydrolase n=1 Tax=Halobacillus sp. B29 TaxID=3457432 RepID=UPI003FCE7278
MKKTVRVVAAVIENEDKEILCALRSPKMSIPNMWEFPGGKVEEGEDLQTALEREIKEELSCEIEAHDVLKDHTHEYDKFIIQLIALKAKIVNGAPNPHEHSKLLWLQRENLSSLRWAPADVPAVELLINQK